MENPLHVYLKGAGWKAAKNGLVWTSPRRKRYLVFGESRPQPASRYLPALLSEAILRARAEAAKHDDVEAVAFLAVERLTDVVHARLNDFVGAVAPDQSWIAADAVGSVFPHVRSAPELALRRGAAPPQATPRKTNLFTDHNQWLLKVLLGQQLPSKWINVPRERSIRNASVLADVANVSIPVASRFVNALDAENFLDRRHGDLRIARPLELLEAWRSRVHSTVDREEVAHFARGSLDEGQFRALMLVLGAEPGVAVGMFGAADGLGLGHVRGAPRYLYVPSFEPRVLEDFGLVLGGGSGQLIIATPRFPESTFRGAVSVDGYRVTDVLQTWLDSSRHQLRGEEQAEHIWRKALKPVFAE